MNNYRPKFERIIKGQHDVTFTNLGLNLLFTRLKTQYEENPTRDQMTTCLSEVDAFVQRYERIVAPELANL